MINKLANEIIKYIKKNRKMPKLITIDKIGYNRNQQAYRLAYAITHNGKEVPRGFHIDNPKNLKGNRWEGTKVYKNDYIKLAKKYTQYVEKNKRTPNYATIHGKKVTLTLLIVEFARIIAYYNKNNRLPNYCTFDSAHTRATTTTKQNNKDCTNPYTSKPHYTNNGCNNLGQCTDYWCGPHSIHQAIRKFGIKDLPESQIAGWAGSTTSGTGHDGINTAIAKIAQIKKITLNVEWRNFSSFGNTRKERFKEIGKLLCQKNTAVFFHILYQNGGVSYDPYAEDFGHYELADKINTSTGYLRILNSLGGYCGNGRCGFIQDRSFEVQEAYLKGLSQPSVCIIRKE